MCLKYAIIELTNINKHMNKYEKWYKNITDRGQTRITNERTESHHIVPKCLGGTDNKNNLTNVTLREHFICHWLLTKIYYGKERHQLLKALWMMKAENQNQSRYKTKITSRVYATLREEYIKLQSIKVTGKGNGFYGKTHTPEAREKIRQKNLGNKLTPEQHARLVANTKGKKKPPITDEHRAKLSAAKRGKNNNRYGVEVSEETRKRIGDKIRGRKQTEEEKLRRGLANLGKTKSKRLCTHCDQMIAVNAYARFHGDKCKQAPI
jgi:hypothetical protein